MSRIVGVIRPLAEEAEEIVESLAFSGYSSNTLVLSLGSQLILNSSLAPGSGLVEMLFVPDGTSRYFQLPTHTASSLPLLTKEV